MPIALPLALLLTLLPSSPQAPRAPAPAAPSTPPATESAALVVCGWDEVFVLDVSTARPRKTWSWRAADRPELPEAYRTKFRTTDDCKPLSGNRLLITASSDGAAVVDRTSGRALWWGACGNTHSADLLPRDRVVLACSIREKTGNRLALFDLARPEREVFSTELESGHGAVWDETRQRLWALGLQELRAYTLKDWASASPSLVLAETFPIPGTGGHELQSVPGTAQLVVTATDGTWRFDRDTKTFTVDADLGTLHHVKSVSIDPVTGRVAYTQADSPDWWTSRIRFLHPGGEVQLPGERLYKVRWDR